MKNADMPAMPCGIATANDGSIYNTAEQSGGTASGLTKRELIAAMAMQGIMSNPELCDLNKTRIAQESCILADALLKALEE